MQSSVIFKHFLDGNNELQNTFIIGLEVDCGGGKWTNHDVDLIFGAILFELEIVNKRNIIGWGLEVITILEKIWSITLN
jgi:hypothetical protein